MCVSIRLYMYVCMCAFIYFGLKYHVGEIENNHLLWFITEYIRVTMSSTVFLGFK